MRQFDCWTRNEANGHGFKSRGEVQIARFLDRNSILYNYEQPLAVVDQGKTRVWYPDFQLPEYSMIIEALRNLYLMAYDVKKVSVVGVLRVTIGSRCMIRVLKRAFHRFRGVTTEAAAAFRTDDGRESFRFNWWKSVNNNVFDPVGMATRTAAILVPIARSGEWFVWLQFQWFVVHRATSQTVRTL